MTLIDNYIKGLVSKYNDAEKQVLNSIPPALDEEINLLKSAYPLLPIELIELLKKVNGSNGFNDSAESSLPFFPTDSDDDASYNFCSIEMMLAHAKRETYWIDIYWNEDSTVDKEELLDDDELFADEINPEALCKDWLLFADNGYSQLFIDFNPSENGIVGQVVRYIHDPDMYDVVEDSFATYLQLIIDSDFEYFNDDGDAIPLPLKGCTSFYMCFNEKDVAMSSNSTSPNDEPPYTG